MIPTYRTVRRIVGRQPGGSTRRRPRVSHEWRLVEVAPDLRVPAGHLYEGRKVRRFPIVRSRLEAVCASVPKPWLGPVVFETPDRQRAAYAAVLWKRIAAFGRE